jgi:superfamily I DNA/RNA helicase
MSALDEPTAAQTIAASLTPQQAEIIALSHQCTPTEMVLVQAAAGTGKTTTIKQFVQARKRVTGGTKETMLYVCFNREAVKEARQSDIFRAAHVDILTCNALTMKWWHQIYLPSISTATQAAPETKEPTNTEHPCLFDHNGRNNLDDNDQDLIFVGKSPTSAEIIALLGTRLNAVTNTKDREKAAQFTWYTYEQFLLGSDRICIEKHVQRFKTKSFQSEETKRLPYDEFVRHLFSLVQHNNPNMFITFSSIDKLCQLSKYQFLDGRHQPYNIIMVDEAQDWNPCQLALMQHQNEAAQLFVGDANQSLYGFRGATGELESLKKHTTKIYQLTTSFRFGPNIAEVANRLLWWKGQVLRERNRDPTCANMRVVGGGGTLGKVVLFEDRKNADPPTIESPVTVLCAMNKSVVHEVIEMVAQYGSMGNGFMVSFVNSKYKNVKELIDQYCSNKKRGSKVARTLLERCIVYGRDQSNVSARVLTVHYSKGLEFSRVRLGSDLVQLINAPSSSKDSTWEHMKPDQYGRPTGPIPLRMKPHDDTDLNLWYVAVTRAQHELQMNEHWSHFVDISTYAGFRERFGTFV